LHMGGNFDVKPVNRVLDVCAMVILGKGKLLSNSEIWIVVSFWVTVSVWIKGSLGRVRFGDDEFWIKMGFGTTKFGDG
jgi:hypothetical protein